MWVVDVEGERGGRTDGDYTRAEFDADGYVVVWGEAAFAEADGELGCQLLVVRVGYQRKDGRETHAGLASSAVADAY